MMIAIIGASIGGLVAAAELRERGFEVTIIERSKSVGGLYGKVDTPFGVQELGMHVLYLNNEHYRHLCTIFGADAFHTWEGYAVDVGACHNFGRNFFDSIYPDVRDFPTRDKIFEQLCQKKGEGLPPSNALEAVIGRFGEEAGRGVIAPILNKLWKLDADQLSKDAIHCFFDLRRIIVCDKARADELKNDPWLDTVIGNPLQSKPRGQVFGGRKAVQIKNTHDDLSDRVQDWLTREGIGIKFERSVEIVGQRFILDGVAMDEVFDGCIVATPVASMAPQIADTLDQLDMSVYYLKLAESVTSGFPAYYILCHASEFASSRIVNYEAYNAEYLANGPFVLAIEVLHPLGNPPSENAIAEELLQVLPQAIIEATYRLPRSLRVPCPSLNNAHRLDALTQGMEKCFQHDALFFAGMRTDKGIFFSHHTIGLAYDSALECARRLS